MATIPEYHGRRHNLSAGQTLRAAVACSGIFSTSTESVTQRTVRAAGTYSNLLITIFLNGVGATSTLRFRKNTADGNQTVSIGAGATGTFEDASNTDAVVAGDLVNFQLVVGAGGTTIRPSNIGCLFAATTNTSLRHGAQGISFATDSSTGYFKVEGPSQTAPTTEGAAEKLVVKVGGTIKQMNVVVTANARASSATTYTSRKNGAAGNLSVSVSASSTGQFEDTSNSDTVSAGDLINRAVTTGAGAGETITANVYTSLETTDGTTQVVGAFNAQSVGSSVTWYMQLFGDVPNAVTTESETQVKLGVACTLSQYECYVGSNTVSATSTLRPRKAAANINGAISITASTTGWFEDTSNSDSIAATDLVNWQIATGGAGTALTLDYLSFKLAIQAAGVVGPLIGGRLIGGHLTSSRLIR